MKTTEPESYLERSAGMNLEATAAELENLSSVIAELGNVSEDLQRVTILSVNTSRKVGIHLQTLCGHEQMKLSFWQSRCQGKLPKFFSFDSAKMCMAIARKMPEEAKTLQEAVHYAQDVLFATNALESPERACKQSSSGVSMIERFFNEFTLMRQPFKKVITATPLETWDHEQLEQFIEETKWLADEREKAEKLLASK